MISFQLFQLFQQFKSWISGFNVNWVMNLYINAKHLKESFFYCILRYKGKDNVGMSIMDIGILTGFAPDQKSLQKVHILLLYLQRILDRFLRIVYLISALRGNSSSLANSRVVNPILSRKWLLILWVVSVIFSPPHHTHTLPSGITLPRFLGVCKFWWCVCFYGVVGKRCQGNCWEEVESISPGKKMKYRLASN